MRTNKRTFAQALVRPRSVLETLDLTEIFGKAARLEVDLGCGDGGFLVELAAQNQATNFLGIERLPGRVRSACRKIGAANLTNARIVQDDILQAVQQFFVPASVDVFHLLFPDPWPKRRHASRRIVNESFLRAVTRALKPAGELRIVTDHADYFAAMRNTLESVNSFTVLASNDSLGIPLTSFEKYFRARGVAVNRIVLRKLGSAC